MFIKILSSAILGIDTYIVKVEAHLEDVSPSKFFTQDIAGLPEGAIKESKERFLADIVGSKKYNLTILVRPSNIVVQVGIVGRDRNILLLENYSFDVLKFPPCYLPKKLNLEQNEIIY